MWFSGQDPNYWQFTNLRIGEGTIELFSSNPDLQEKEWLYGSGTDPPDTHNLQMPSKPSRFGRTNVCAIRIMSR